MIDNAIRKPQKKLSYSLDKSENWLFLTREL
jgi:hypothetical protein